MTLLDQPVDLDARTVIRHDLERNLFVEAGAGTGKTTVLVDRVVNLVARGRIRQPGGLVAITFTEAAAAELRDRIREQLERAASDGARTAEERRRCEQAVARIDEAFITTLHGFAHRLLTAWPLEAGLPPAFEVDDEITAGICFAERWRLYCDEVFADPRLARPLEVGFTLGMDTGALREVALELHRRWDRLVSDEPAPTPAPTPAIGSVVEPVGRAAGVAGDLVGDEDDVLAGKLRSWLELVARIHRASGPSGVAGASVGSERSDPNGDALGEVAMLDALVSADVHAGAGSGRKSCWGDRKAAVCALLDEAHAARLALLAAHRRRVIEDLLPSLRRLTLDGAEGRRRRGRLEFHDLLVHARDLLRGNPEVCAAAAASFDVVLIDEFQDTDPLQLDIAFLLTAADPGAARAGWEGTALAPGKLVIVGDPTQSIYAFRGADIRLWSRARDRFAPGDTQRLRQNFRSVPSVLAWVNDVFEQLIGEGSDGTQPRYVSLHPARRGLDELPAVVVVGEPAEEAMPEIRAREAADVAGLVITMKAQRMEVVDRDGADARARGGEGRRPLRYADIAVLVPTRAPLGPLERALDRADIPYRVESRSLVWATDVVRQLLAVLAAVDDPSDHVAVVASLRSPGFACSDDDLLRWRAAGGSWDYRRPPPDAATGDAATGDAATGAVAEAMDALRGYHEQRWWLPAHQLVEQVVRQRRLAELAFAQRRPRDHWRRLRFVVDAARAFVEAGGQALGDFVAWAVQQGDEGAQAIETVTPEADDDAVRILTVHGSKGLEFPVVVLAGLNAAKPPDTTRVRWGEHGPQVRAGTSSAGYFETAGYAELESSARLANAHESVRLLYVAATRARDHLVLSLHHKPMGARQESHAEVLWRVCGDLRAGWRPARLSQQLVLGLLDEDTAPPPTADELAEAVATRAAWVADRERVLAATRTRRVLTASALADLAHDKLAHDKLAHDDLAHDEWTPGPADDPGHRELGGWAPPPDAGGAAIGRAVHGVLQAVELTPAGTRDVAALARAHASTEGIPETAGQVAALALGALSSPTIVQARSAQRRWRELFVAAPVGGRLLEGYVDLLFEDSRGELVVVDYKTDRARTDADLDRAVARHRLQGAAYALAVEIALGRPVGRCVFVFARPGGSVERAVTDLPAAVAEARALLCTR